MMDFIQAEQQRQQLSGQLSREQITRDQYMAAINALRVTDPQGRWWQPDPAGPGWLAWNGSVWSPATPPSGTGGLQPGTAKDFVEFRSQLMTVDEFKKMSKEVPLAKRPQKWWDLLSILGGVAAAILWLLYSGNPWGEGVDIITCVLMVGLPIFMIWYRADIDVLLLPVQQYRKDVNKLLLVGIGMAFPFLSSFILFTLGIREYELMQSNMIIGMLGAYIITRNPVISLPGAGSHQGSGKPPAAATNAILAIFLAVICYFLVLPVRADDCLQAGKYGLNARDCDRTMGYAQVISGTPPAVSAGLVNGKGIHDTITSGGSGGPQSPPASQTTQPGLPVPPAKPAGPDSLPVNPDDVQNIDEAIRDTRAESQSQLAGAAAQAAAQSQTPAQPLSPPPEPQEATEEELRQIEEALAAMHREKVEIAAAAAAAAAAAQASEAAAAAAAQGIDPLTGKRILTPEQQERRDFLRQEMERTSHEAAESLARADRLGYFETGFSLIEKTADIAIDIGATLSPGAGGRIKNIYGVTKTIARNLSQSYADGAGLEDGLKRGVVEVATDKVLDAFAGKVTERLKVPGFGKYESHADDMGNMGFKQIRERLNISATDTGDFVQNLRNAVTQRNTEVALKNSVKNAVQGQVQGATLWDPFKKFFGISR